MDPNFTGALMSHFLPRATGARRATLVVVCLATAMLMLDIAVVNTALPDISHDLDAGLGGLQWVVDAYTLALATIVVSMGSLADRLGRRRVFIAGLALFTAASLACALAGSIPVLDVARAVQGVGAAAMFAVSLALLAGAFPGARERAGALAVYGATIGASFAVGPLAGGALTTAFGWRSIFLLNLPLGAVCIAATVARVAESRDLHARSIDWAGQGVLASGLFLLVLALLRGNDDGWTSTLILAELAGALAMLGVFALVESRVHDPLLPLGLFRDPVFTGAQVGAFAISGSFYAVFLYTTLYLQNVLHLSAVEAGLAYMPATAVMLIAGAATAAVGTRVSAGTTISAALALVAVGMVLLTTTGTGSAWWVILPGEIVALVGSGLFNPTVSAVALGSVPDAQSGLAAGVNDTFRQAGIAVGTAALGVFIPARSALGHGSPDAFVHALHRALIVGAALAAVGSIATARLLRGWRPEVATSSRAVASGLAFDAA
jgi:EmrB/QacA subfamily drug resistance transporter